MGEGSELLVAGVARIEARDLVRAYDEIPALRQRWLLIGLGLAALGFAWNMVQLVRVPGARLAAHDVFTGALVVLFGLAEWSSRQRGKRAWRALEEWQRQLRFELGPERLRIRTELSSEELDWTLCGGWLESADAFYVKTQGVRFHVIPKRAFADDGEVEIVRELLRSNVHEGSAPKAKLASGSRTLLFWVLLVMLFIAVYLMVVAR